MSLRPELAELAARLVAARRPGNPRLENAAGAPLHSEEDCYAVQRAVTAELGPAGGFKVARKPGQQIMAPILARDIRRSPGVFGPEEIDRIGIELELGFLVTAPLPAATAADFEAQARRCVAVVPVIEVVDSRFADLGGASALLRLADNQINGGLVVGEPCNDWERLDLVAPLARLELGDEIALDGPARVPGGNAWESFCALARSIDGHCGGLNPGQVVITGSLNGMPFVERGTRVRGEIAGLGSVAAEFPL